MARRILRRGLGNHKRRVKDLREFAMDMYVKGVVQGSNYMRGRIHNSVSALEYGRGYYVAPTVESEDGHGRINDSGSDVDGAGVGGLVAVDIPVAIPEDAGSDNANYPRPEQVPGT